MNKLKELNDQAWELVELVTKEEKNITNNNPLTGSLKEKDFVDWTDKVEEGNFIERKSGSSGEIIGIYLSDNNAKYGFGEKTHHMLNKVVEGFQSLNDFEKVSLKFIEEKSLEWSTDIYKKSKARCGLYEFLKEKINNEIKKHTIFFPIVNLEIENTFKIGNVEFTYFVEDDFNEGKIDEYYKDFKGRVCVKITINAERSRAIEIAKQDAETAVNILKMYSDSVLNPRKRTMFDILTYQLQSNYLVSTEGNYSSDYHFNNDPFVFNNESYESAYQCGLGTFSNFILSESNNELHDIIIQSINLFGSAISNNDLHLRCVNLITILESIFLKVKEKNNMERKVKSRLSKCITGQTQHQKREELKNDFSHIYQIRHKILHKARRIDIDYEKLSKSQRNIVEILLKLIDFNINYGIKDRLSLIKKLNEIKS